MNDHPPQIHLHPYHLDADGHLSRTMIVTGYPRQVRAGWADPLLTYPGDADISLHLAPIPASMALRRLRHRRARLESAWRTDTLRGLLEDPHRTAAYAAHGITATDPATWERTPPVLSDLVTALRRDAEAPKAARLLADRLSAFTQGTHRGLLDGPTTAHPTGHLTTVTLCHLPAELRTVGLLLILDALWRRITDPIARRPRLIVIDEGWTLLQDPVGARYLFNLAKNARRHWAGLTLLTQDVADLLATDLGRAVAANAATQILLRQAPQNLDAVCDSFHLSHGERHIVATAERGTSLLAAGRHRTVFRALASPVEHRLITTDPTETTDTEGTR